MNFRNYLKTLFLLFVGFNSCSPKKEVLKPIPPNILFCISDDQTWLHTSFAGANQLQTPAFDRVAGEGIYFKNAYCAASSCAASRAAILTGQEIWRLDEGGLLFGGLPKNHQVFTELLRQNGYATAWTGKGYAPANLKDDQYWKKPIGKSYHQHKKEVLNGRSSCDYATNFNQFMDERDPEQPFFFWYGGYEPHRGYEQGIGERSGKDLSKITVPGFLPDNEISRGDIADYYYEIEWFDKHLGKMIEKLEATGELENTIIIVTSDNGMPFPRAKTTSYEYGTHMPLAICWGNKIKGARKLEDFISFTDFAPTILEAVGIDIPKEMTGKSFMDVLKSEKDGQVNPERIQVFTALERHTYCRPDGLPYPIRSIRKGEFLYLHNFTPERYPGGNPDFNSPHQGFYGDIDTGPTKEDMLSRKKEEDVAQLFHLSFGKRPQEELYNVVKDPENLHNLAEDVEFTQIKKELKSALFSYLERTTDPRMKGESPWDHMPFYFEGYDGRHLKPVGQRD